MAAVEEAVALGRSSAGLDTRALLGIDSSNVLSGLGELATLELETSVVEPGDCPQVVQDEYGLGQKVEDTVLYSVSEMKGMQRGRHSRRSSRHQERCGYRRRKDPTRWANDIVSGSPKDKADRSLT